MSRLSLSTFPGLTVGGLPVRLSRSQRRTVGLRVTAQGLTVYAPQRAGEARLRRLVEEKRVWAERHSQQLQQQQHVAAPLVDGFALPFLGQTLILRAVPDLKRAARIEGELHAPAHDLSASVAAWYRAEALRLFPALAWSYAARLERGRPLSGVRLTNAAGRWGSCTAAGVVRLHWKLLLAPPDIMRYVAAHEVAHLAELNHSPRYWAELERLFPAYREAEQWLKQCGAALMRAWT